MNHKNERLQADIARQASAYKRLDEETDQLRSRARAEKEKLTIYFISLFNWFIWHFVSVYRSIEISKVISKFRDRNTNRPKKRTINSSILTSEEGE